jgi:phospholipid N-methyltransferase
MEIARPGDALGKALDSARSHVRMLRSFARQPFRTGTLVPSSRELAELMVLDVGLESAGTVVELGAGTGVFTRLIAEHVSREAVVLAFEIDAELARGLDGTIPGVRIVNDTAEHLDRHLRDAGRGTVDVVLSGLPWANFSRGLQERLLRVVLAGLRPGGRFATFAYAGAAQFPSGRRFRRLLEASFAKVETTRTVYRNFPPAFVYRCTAG